MSTLIAAMVILAGTISGSIPKEPDRLNDCQIIRAILALDQIDIEYSKIALSKSKNKMACEIAKRMIANDPPGRANTIELANKITVKEENSPTNESFRIHVVDTMGKLHSLSDEKVNEHYIDYEVSHHKYIMDVVATVLVPDAPYIELKSVLEDAQMLSLKYLEFARMVQSGKRKPIEQTHTILIKGAQFVPERLEVSVGDTVIWKNVDIVPHTATAKKGFDSRKLGEGQSWSFKARQKGSFPYICTYHPTMQGELIIK